MSDSVMKSEHSNAHVATVDRQPVGADLLIWGNMWKEMVITVMYGNNSLNVDSEKRAWKWSPNANLSGNSALSSRRWTRIYNGSSYSHVYFK